MATIKHFEWKKDGATSVGLSGSAQPEPTTGHDPEPTGIQTT
jgi:hypothetical protein